MGNVLTQDYSAFESDEVESDRQYLSLGTAAVFNDAYVYDQFSKLPPFADTEINSFASVHLEHLLSPSNSNNIAALRQLQYILRKDKKAQSVTVDNFPALSFDTQGFNASDDGYEDMMKRRSRLLQRIHLAMLRDSKRQNAGSSNSSQFGSSFLKLPPLREDIAVTMSAFSIRMCVTTVQALNQISPGVSSEMCGTLLELLGKVDPRVLQRVSPGSVAEDMVTSIVQVRLSIGSRN